MSEMTVAEKLSAIGNNMAKVYDTGFDKGYEKGYGEAGNENYSEGFEAGKQAEYDAFWDAYQPALKYQSYQFAFANYGWNDETFKPKYDIVLGLGYTGERAFWQNQVTNIAETLEKLGVKLDTTLCGHMTSMFQQSVTKRLPEINCTHAMDYNETYGLQNTFTNSQVETIDKLIVPEELKYVSTFNGCANLENIVFEGVIGQDINFQWSTKLTKASIESIITHLSDTATGKTLTLSDTAIFNAFTDEEWWALIANKPNWTIVGGYDLPLSAPSIELSDTTLNIYDEEGLATSYDILVDGEVKATTKGA